MSCTQKDHTDVAQKVVVGACRSHSCIEGSVASRRVGL